jgi:hypothetical protein
MNKYYTIHFAQAYGEGSYSACTYNDSTSCSTSSGSGSGSSGSGGVLANTGIMVAGFVTIACLIVFAALVVRVWRRPSKKPTAPEVVADDQDENETI